MSKLNKDFIVEQFKEATKEADYLIECWSQFWSEPFMAGKVEGAEVIKHSFVKAFGKLLEACDD